jgi:hypothetical protein
MDLPTSTMSFSSLTFFSNSCSMYKSVFWISMSKTEFLLSKFSGLGASDVRSLEFCVFRGLFREISSGIILHSLSSLSFWIFLYQTCIVNAAWFRIGATSMFSFVSSFLSGVTPNDANFLESKICTGNVFFDNYDSMVWRCSIVLKTFRSTVFFSPDPRFEGLSVLGALACESTTILL